VFATLLGALPRPTDNGGPISGVDRLVETAVRAQEDAGLEPITDGRLRGPFAPAPTPEGVVAAWRSLQAMSERSAKASLPGPFSHGTEGWDAGAVAKVVQALGAAGCPMVEIEETTLDRLTDAGERNRFADMHQRLVEGAPGTHLSLSDRKSVV